MKYHRQYLFLFFCALTGCTLIPPPEANDGCPNAEYYLNANGEKEGYFTDISDMYYQQYSETHYCPSEYPVCFESKDSPSFCHALCRDYEAFCEKCIDARNNDQHCGARGHCTNSVPESENYMGVACGEAQRCSEGICTCAREGEVLCDRVCVDPDYNDKYCGAKGSCTENDPQSKDYKGMNCIGGQRCDGGTCTCAKEGEVFCGSSCIDPTNSTEHCGARGLCNEDDPESDNYSGGKCSTCNNSQCECEEGYHLSGNSCEEDDKTHCGDQGDIDCTQINHATNVACIQKHCVIKKCEEGYFLSADGDKCITCSELVSDVKSVGDSIFFGHYRQKPGNDDNKYPIHWQVLDVEDDGITVISKYILDSTKYNETSNTVTWETSTLRSWLNGFDSSKNLDGKDYSNDSFIQTAFNEEELKCIQQVTNQNLDNQNYGTEGGENTEDKVFLLSLCEAGYTPGADKPQCPSSPVYFNTNEDRLAYATEYAIYEIGIIQWDQVLSINIMSDDEYYNATHYRAQWRLRSPGHQERTKAYVGYGDILSTRSQSELLGIRPVIRLKPASKHEN